MYVALKAAITVSSYVCSTGSDYSVQLCMYVALKAVIQAVSSYVCSTQGSQGSDYSVQLCM